ncbi:MAG: hypothetical protein JWM21_77 [Acidobacteria bacterium]|nr:hypothetical protein [Acidobacteriota bacterium]
MNCEKFLAAANELAREQQEVAAVPLMEVNERRQVLAHADECVSCAARWEEEKRLTLGLRDLAQDMNTLAAPAEFEEKMLAAFRERDKVIPVVRPFPVTPARSSYWLAAIAAALLLVFGILVVRARLDNGSRPLLASTWTGKAVDTGNIRSDIEKASALESKPLETLTAVRTPHRKPRNSLASLRSSGKHLNESANATAVAANAAENTEATKEVATDFFPIGYGTGPNLQDGGQLLRVELPRSAVARFGLPVNIDRTSERVKADVLVGADGLAQAIRFIH